MTPNVPNTLLLTFDEVAELTGLSLSSVRRAADRGELRVTRIGSTARFTRASIDSWISSSTYPASPTATSASKKKKGAR